VRTGTTLSYLLSDHLGSSSVTTDANGVQTAAALYKAFGETCYTSGALGTDYKFTGQREEASLGLYFYGARWYDGSLGRFVQADTIVPGGVQGLDRYAAMDNNPVRYSDPTGHFSIVPLLIVGAIVAAPVILSRFGLTADIYGVMMAGAVNTGQGGDALIMAGIAVQSGNPVAMFTGDDRGWAQGSSDELNGRNPFSPSASTEIMHDRIYNAIGACRQCNSRVDKLIVAALAQNGFDFSSKSIGKGFPLKGDGNINWGEFLSKNGGNPSSGIARMRQDITNMNYDTQLMLKIYIQDLQLLVSMGYELPDWLTEEDIQTIVDNDYFYEEDEE
jgi:RHS repeat-associated protein